jgi:hypothetical protein
MMFEKWNWPDILTPGFMLCYAWSWAISLHHCYDRAAPHRLTAHLCAHPSSILLPDDRYSPQCLKFSVLYFAFSSSGLERFILPCLQGGDHYPLNMGGGYFFFFVNIQSSIQDHPTCSLSVFFCQLISWTSSIHLLSPWWNILRTICYGTLDVTSPYIHYTRCPTCPMAHRPWLNFCQESSSNILLRLRHSELGSLCCFWRVLPMVSACNFQLGCLHTVACRRRKSYNHFRCLYFWQLRPSVSTSLRQQRFAFKRSIHVGRAVYHLQQGRYCCRVRSQLQFVAIPAVSKTKRFLVFHLQEMFFVIYAQHMWSENLVARAQREAKAIQLLQPRRNYSLAYCDRFVSLRSCGCKALEMLQRRFWRVDT